LPRANDSLSFGGARTPDDMTTSTTGGAAAATALPLDWTRLGRGRGDVEDGPCPDVLCNGCLPPSSADAEQLENGKVVAMQGTAVLCLPDADNDWFQGYFFPSNNSSPGDGKSNKTNVYKLLCVQQDDADPCLHCDDYQLWTVTVYYYEYYYHPTAATATTTQQTTKKQLTCTFRNVVSRGGDSIRWHHARIRFAAGTVATGRKAHVLVEQYFAGLLRSLLQEEEEDEPDDNDEADSSSDDGNNDGGGDKTSGVVAAVMPNVAVVTGDMTMWLPGGAILAKE
jgi:hypothetical protein